MAKKKQSGLSYADAGVDIDAGNKIANRFQKLMQSTYGPQVLRNDGGFGGMYSLKGVQGLFARSLTDPVLVSGTDGVGTKLQVAIKLGKHDTIGIDLVAMSVNDILVQGAEPLFFLDYVVTDKVDEDVHYQVVKGVAEGCKQAGCALLGGETAEHPDCFPVGEYDLAGFAVGIVERKRMITGKEVEAGDVILGLPSTGLHSNGFTLARKAVFEAGGVKVDDIFKDTGNTFGEELLTPTQIYVKPVLDVLKAYKKKRPVHAIAHITGGGIVENVPRVLPEGCNALIDKSKWDIPPIFNFIRKSGKISEKEMYRVFNMGIGMILVCSQASVDAISRKLKSSGINASIIGQIVEGRGKVKFGKI